MSWKNENNFLHIDVSLLSHENLVEIIKQLKDSTYEKARKKAQKELARRLKEKGFDKKGIVKILTNNLYGTKKTISYCKRMGRGIGNIRRRIYKTHL